MILMVQLKQVLADGGKVRFNWRTCKAELFDAQGVNLGALDGRTYQGFLTTVADTLKRTETGSTDTKDLIIEWKTL